jgi:hypothetical protein
VPRVTTIQTNFSAGELSPRLFGRVDLDRYQNGADVLENVVLPVQGGARRRDGLRYVATVKTPAKRTRVIPFVYSTTDAYVLEFGDLYLRFYKNGVQLGGPYEVVTPFTEAMLFDIAYVQSADTMFLVHPSLVPQRLRRFGDTNWVLDAVPFDVQPFDEIGDSFATGLTLSAATVGAARTATSGVAVFQNSDVGRSIIYQGGTFKITIFTDSSHVTGDITSAFPSVNVPSGLWTLTGSPQETITPSAKDPVETDITLTASALNTWRASDVGKYVRINGGLCLIITFTSATVVHALIKEALTGVTAAPKNSWSLESSVWSATNGYPRAVTLYQQRLVVGGTTAFPQTIWGSSIGAYLDFTLGVFDDDAFSYTLASDQINPIVHLTASKILVALTYGGEFTVRGGVEKPLTPTNVQVDSQTVYGAAAVRPVRVAKEILFVQRAGLKVRALSYNPDTGEYDSPDLAVFAEHITASGLADLAYIQEPDPIVLAPRVDGVLATLAISRVQEVTAWSRQTTAAAGIFESVCTIPVAGGEQTWCVIKRTVNGAATRFVERFDPALVYSMDAAVAATAAATAVWGGLAHLNGETVQCVADGAFMGTFVVSGGQITLPRTALSTVIGLAFTHRVKMLTPEIQTGTGTAQGNSMRTGEVTARFLSTYACDVNGQPYPFAQFGSGLLDDPPTPFSGTKRIEKLGWDRGASDLEFSSSFPFPFHLLSVIRKFSVND